MPRFAIALLIRPFVAFVMLYAAVKISWWIRPLIPARWRPVLYRRLNAKR